MDELITKTEQLKLVLVLISCYNHECMCKTVCIAIIICT